MKSLFLFLIILLISVSSKTFSQDALPLNSIKEVESLKESKKGKVILVNFWATWCVPCVKEFPELVKLYNNYKDKDFEILFISTDVPEDIENKVKPFLKKNGVDFLTYYNNIDKVEELINYFDKKWEGAIPSTYIYDKQGNLTASILGRRNYEEFETEIKKNLN
ncbi:MAG: TlpA disulfide reductase family protein [Ignavibacteria bacterium]